jgi:signal transduction histidine kinase
LLHDLYHLKPDGIMAIVLPHGVLFRGGEEERIRKNLIENIRMLSGSFEFADHITVSVQVSPENMEVFADEKMISQVLINLVRNAFQANDENHFANVKLLAGIGENKRPRICVIDNGPGIPPEIIDEIFVPFFTTRENGSGIGLSISRQIMRLHNGSLKVKSVPGEETVLYEF